MEQLRDSGFSMLSVLLALLVVAVIYFGLLAPAEVQSQPQQAALDIRQARSVGQQTACRSNRQELQRSLLTWSVTHPGETPSLDALRRSGFHVPDCPAGGLLRVKGQRVLCSLHRD